VRKECLHVAAGCAPLAASGLLGMGKQGTRVFNRFETR